MPEDAVSTSDDRQPYHVVAGRVLTQREWREHYRDASQLLEDFKRAAYKAKEI